MKEKLKTTKALITFDSKTLKKLDKYAKKQFMGNRSQAANYLIDTMLSKGNLLNYLVKSTVNEKGEKRQ